MIAGSKGTAKFMEQFYDNNTLRESKKNARKLPMF